MAKPELLFKTPYGLLRAPAGGAGGCSFHVSEQGKLSDHPWTLQGENIGWPAAGKCSSLVLPSGGKRKNPKALNLHPHSLRGILGSYQKTSSVDSNSESSVKRHLDEIRTSSVPAITLDLASRVDSELLESPLHPRERCLSSPSSPSSMPLERPKRRGGDQIPPASRNSGMRRSMSALTVDANCNVVEDGSFRRRLRRSASAGSLGSATSFASMMRASAEEDGRSSALSSQNCLQFAGQRRPHEETLPFGGRKWFCTIKKLS